MYNIRNTNEKEKLNKLSIKCKLNAFHNFIILCAISVPVSNSVKKNLKILALKDVIKSGNRANVLICRNVLA